MRISGVAACAAFFALVTSGCNDGASPAPAPASAPGDAAPPLTVSPAASAAMADAAVPSQRRLVLRAARALSPKTGAMTEPAYLSMSDGRVVGLAAQAPADALSVTDLGDVTLLPGLIDAHTHLLHEETREESSMVAEVAMMTDADRALRGVAYAKQMLHAGFTTVRDLGNSGRGADVSLQRAIRKGWAEGPSMLVSTRALAPPGGQFPRLNPASQALIDAEYAVVRSADEGRAAVTQAFYEGADWIKVIVDHGAGRTLGEPELRAIVETAHRSDKKVAAHVLGEKAAALAVAVGVDSVEHGYHLSDATLAEMAKKKIALVPTDYPLDYYTPLAPNDASRQVVLDALKKQRESSVDRMRRARKAKVTIVAGSDAYLATALGDRGKEAALIFGAYAEADMTPLEIVQAATVNAAALLGLPASSETLEPGSAADVIAVRGDPARDVTALSRVVAVVKAGRLVWRIDP